MGLYTSPHLKDFRERIRVDGAPIGERYVVDFVESERGFFEPLHPSFFELTTAMAFKYFKEQGVDFAVVEVGLGGRLDCTNIIAPVLSVITNISFDHTQFLGDTLAKIAAEKAGIIKCGVPVVVGESLPETRPVFAAKAAEAGAPIAFAEDDAEVTSARPDGNGGMAYATKHFGTLYGELGGIYQAKNANTVLTAIRQLTATGTVCATDGAHSRSTAEAAKAAFARVSELTGLMGRWQKVRSRPTVICDTGHNVGGWKYLGEQLRQVECRKMHIVFGMVDDKDIDGVLSLLPKQASYYFTKPSTKRALPEQSVKAKAQQHGLCGECFPSVGEAYEAARSAAGPYDFIFVGGSSYVVADFLTLHSAD